MKTEPAELRHRLDEFKTGLKRAGVKVTHQRLEIFQEVAKSGDHPDAVTIYKAVRKRLPTISLDTVYRTLWLLLDLGLISTLGAQNKVRFDGNMRQHHHFVCTNCSTTYDFYDSAFNVLKIPDAVQALGHVEKTQVEFTGLCLRCKQHRPSHQPKLLTQ